MRAPDGPEAEGAVIARARHRASVRAEGRALHVAGAVAQRGPHRRVGHRLAKGGLGVGRRAGVHGAGGEQEGPLGVEPELGPRGGGELSGPGHVLALDRVVALHQGEHAEADGDGQSGERRSHDELEPAGAPPAARVDEADLTLGRPRLGPRRGAGQPGLGLGQGAAAQEQAAVAARRVPARGRLEPAGMGPHPPEVGVRRPQQLVHRGPERVALAHAHVLARGHLVRGPLHLPAQDGDDALAARDGPVQLLAAVLRRHPVGAHHDHDGVGGVDGRGQLVAPPGGRGDVLAVHPDGTPRASSAAASSSTKAESRRE